MKHKLDPRKGIISLATSTRPRNLPRPLKVTEPLPDTTRQIIQETADAVRVELIEAFKQLLQEHRLTPTLPISANETQYAEIQIDESVVDVGITPTSELKKGQESAKIATTQAESDTKLSASKRKLKKLKGK